MTLSSLQLLAAYVRPDFPALQQTLNGYPLVYLDSAATSQKPLSVLNALRDYYESGNFNIRHGVCQCSERASDLYEAAREKVARFINASSPQEIVYTHSATESINLVAYSWGMNCLKAGDEIILLVMEHVSNLIPWQMVAEKTGAILKFVELNEAEEFDLDHFRALLSDRAKLVSVVHLSHSLGCINPVQEITALARDRGAKVLIDASQSLAHFPVDVQQIDCDWLVGSGHKMGAPVGIGFLYGKWELLQAMPPFQGGAHMYSAIAGDRATYADAPYKFEAGTPAIADAIALGAAAEYLSEIGMKAIYAEEINLTEYLIDRLHQIPGLRTCGAPLNRKKNNRVAIVTFTLEGTDTKQLPALLDRSGVVINAGVHDAQMLHERLGIESTARVSLSFFNTRTDIDRLVSVLQQIVQAPVLAMQL